MVSILHALRAPVGNGRDVGRKAEQIDHLFGNLKPKILIFDEFHNALRGRSRDVEAVLAFLRRIGRQFDVSQVLIGEVAVFDLVNATSEMVSRFDLLAVPRWHYGDEFLTLLDSLEGALPLARCSDLFDEKLARKIFQLSEGLIGEIIAIVTTAAAAAARCGTERITMAALTSCATFGVDAPPGAGAWRSDRLGLCHRSPRAITGRRSGSVARVH
jgi:hypothetical protein